MPSFTSTLRQLFSNRNFVVLTVSDVLFLVGATLWWPFQALYILELGASKQILGMIMMLQSASMLIFQLPGGILADRFGRKRVLIPASFLRCVPPILYLVANHWVVIIPGVIINALSSVDLPAWQALLAESLPVENRGVGYGFHSTLISIPRIFLMPLGGILLDSVGLLPGMRLCLMLNSVLIFIYSLILWGFLIETKGEDKGRGSERQEEKGEQRSVVQGMKTLPKEIWVLVLVGGLSSFAINLSMSFMVVYADEVIGLTKTEWGFTGTLLTLISTVMTTPSGFLADRVGRKSCILFSNILSLISTFGFINSHDFKGVLLSRGVGGAGSGFGGIVSGVHGGPVWQALVADLAPSETRGIIIALIGTITGSLGTPSPWIGGYLYDNISSVLPFQLNIALRVGAMAIFTLFLKEPRDRAR
ncbi:MAG: MFS transporter [Candidatus Bathyarchaeia archaeon]